MLISDVMTRNPFHVNIRERIKTAKKIISDNQINHLPVVDDHFHVAGLITDRDIKLSQAVSDDPDFHENAKVSEVCVKFPYKVGLYTPLLEVVEYMLAEHIGSALIAEDEKLVGIFTKTDACRVLAGKLRGEI